MAQLTCPVYTRDELLKLKDNHQCSRTCPIGLEMLKASDANCFYMRPMFRKKSQESVVAVQSSNQNNSQQQGGRRQRISSQNSNEGGGAKIGHRKPETELLRSPTGPLPGPRPQWQRRRHSPPNHHQHQLAANGYQNLIQLAGNPQKKLTLTDRFTLIRNGVTVTSPSAPKSKRHPPNGGLMKCGAGSDSSTWQRAVKLVDLGC